MKYIKLTQGKEAIVDDEDFEWLNQWKWHYHKSGYAVRNYWEKKKCKQIKMHRLVNSTPDKSMTDHINRNKLDNRRENLRTCTNQENQYNRVKNQVSMSRFRGVRRWQYNGRPLKWLAYIGHHGKYIYIGQYQTDKEAAKAYNSKATELFGEFARLNEV